MWLEGKDVANPVTRPLWLDHPNAEAEAERRAYGKPDLFLRAAQDLIRTGLTVIRDVVDPSLCDKVRIDYEAYLLANREAASRYVDDHNRQLRLVNFHLASHSAMELGTTQVVMELQDFLFGYRAGLYTSLTFKHGTQQPIHRDSPFFHTFPLNYFLGVWFPLEDIHPDSGPVMYVGAAQHFYIDYRGIFETIVSRFPEKSRDIQIRMALEEYYGEVMRRSREFEEPRTCLLNRGDILIWHGATPHGGSVANNPDMTRYSMVFHNAPEDIQVYQHDVLFYSGLSTGYAVRVRILS